MRLLALLLMNAQAALGPPVRGEGFTIRPPASFRMARMELFGASSVGAVGAHGEHRRQLVAALIDGTGPEAATLLLSVVETPFSVAGLSREHASVALKRHLLKDLGIELELEAAELVTSGGVARAEAWGQVKAGAQARRVMAATWLEGSRHVVALVSAPVERWAELTPDLTESLSSFRFEGRASKPPAWAGWMIAVALAAALLGSVGLWSARKRRAAQR